MVSGPINESECVENSKKQALKGLFKKLNLDIIIE